MHIHNTLTVSPGLIHGFAQIRAPRICPAIARHACQQASDNINQVRAAAGGDTGARQEVREIIKAGLLVLPDTGVLQKTWQGEGLTPRHHSPYMAKAPDRRDYASPYLIPKNR